MTDEIKEFSKLSNRSILHEFTPIIFHASSYLVGLDLIPKEYGYNIEIETEMINGELDVIGVNYWEDGLPSKGYIERTKNFKERVLFNINGSDKYRPNGMKKKILNFIIGQLKLGEDEVVYERYLLGRRLYVYGGNDTQKNYYWYGIGNEIISNVESDASEGEELTNLLSESIVVNNLNNLVDEEIPN